MRSSVELSKYANPLPARRRVIPGPEQSARRSLVITTHSPPRPRFRLARVARFSFETTIDGLRANVTLRGELDLPATAELEPELTRLAEEPGVSEVALDLRALDYLDSSGLRSVLHGARVLAENDRRLVLVRGPSGVQRVFELMRATERLDFVDAT
jgi:anti-anti-sigma factor